MDCETEGWCSVRMLGYKACMLIGIGGEISKYYIEDDDSTCNNSMSLFDEFGIGYALRLSWPRRKCKGFGFIHFDEKQFPIAKGLLSGSTLYIKGNYAYVNKDVKNVYPLQLFIAGLGPDTTSKDVTTVVRELLPPDVHIEKCTVSYDEPFSTSRTELNVIADSLINICSQYFDDVEAYVPKVHRKAAIMKAYLNVSNFQDAITLRSKLEGIKVCDSEFEAQFAYIIAVTFPTERTKMVRSYMMNILDIHDEFSNVKVKNADGFHLCHIKHAINKFDKHTSVLELKSWTIAAYEASKVITEKLVKGRLFTNASSDYFQFLYYNYDCDKLVEHLRALNEDFAADFKYFAATNTLRIYGIPRQCQLVAENVDHIFEYEVNSCWIIKQPYRPQHFYAIIRTHGLYFRDILNIYRLFSVEVDFKNYTIIVSSYLKNWVYESIRFLDKIPLDEIQSIDLEDGKWCCSCQSFVQIWLTCNLEQCGHTYCLVCLNNLVMDSKRPIICSVQGCNEELSLRDIMTVWEVNDENIILPKFLKYSMDAFFKRNESYFKKCYTELCPKVYNTSDVEGSTWTCPLCNIQVCIECGQGYMEEETYILGLNMFSCGKQEIWDELVANLNPSRKCPDCESTIENSEGFQHIACTGCGKHFCWHCLLTVPTCDFSLAPVYHKTYCEYGLY